MSVRNEHDWDFALFALAGFLIAFGFISVSSIGIPILLLGLALLVGRWMVGPSWPADLGLLAGGGSVCLAIAALGTLGPPGGWLIAGAAAIGGSSFACWWL